MGKFVSPLRYPGGKAKNYSFISSFIRQHYSIGDSYCPPIYCEPFAGGFGLGLELLRHSDVENVILNDYDFCIYAFWKSITDQQYYDEFVSKLKTTEITINEWQKQRSIYLNYSKHSIPEVGFATMYLNRCNRSGILSAYPIGGILQDGKYKIGCRFNREALLSMCREIYEAKNKIQVENLDAIDLLKKVDSECKTVFFNLDPPYVTAGPLLYKNTYIEEDHRKLSEVVKGLKNHWIVTYDDNSLITDIYSDEIITRYDLMYSLEKKRKATELLIVDKLFFNESA